MKSNVTLENVFLDFTRRTHKSAEFHLRLRVAGKSCIPELRWTKSPYSRIALDETYSRPNVSLKTSHFLSAL